MSVPNFYLVTVTVTAVVTIAVAIADFIPAGFVLANSAQVGVPRSWLPLLGGLVAFFIGAVIAHLRAGVLYNIGFPAGYLLLSTASLVMLLA